MAYLPDVDLIKEVRKVACIYSGGPQVLVSGGPQWCMLTSTVLSGINYEFSSISENPPRGGTLVEFEVGYVAGLKGNVSSLLIFSLDARNSGGAWATIISGNAGIAATEVEMPMQGVLTPGIGILSGLTKPVFDVRTQLMAGATNAGAGRLKESSWLRYVYKPS